MSIQHTELATIRAQEWIATMHEDNLTSHQISGLNGEWGISLGVVKNTLGTLTAQIPTPCDDDLVWELWATVIGHHQKGEDIASVAGPFIQWARPMGHVALAGMAYGEAVRWRDRDAFLVASTPIIIDYLDQAGEHELARTVLEFFSHDIVSLACRDNSRTYELLERFIRPYFTPDSTVFLNAGGKQGPWIESWVVHHLDPTTRQLGGETALEWLLQWGIDVNAPIEETVILQNCGELTQSNRLLAKLLREATDKPWTADVSLYPIEKLVEHGVYWQDLLEHGSQPVQAILRDLPAVRREKLLDHVAPQANATVPAQRKI